MKKILSWTAVGIMSIGALGACSSDKKSPSTTAAPEVTTGDDTATTAASGDDTATTAASGESSAAVDEFCAKVTDLVTKGPTDPEYATKLQELIASSQSLITTLTPADQAKIQECVTELTPGG